MGLLVRLAHFFHVLKRAYAVLSYSVGRKNLMKRARFMMSILVSKQFFRLRRFGDTAKKRLDRKCKNELVFLTLNVGPNVQDQASKRIYELL